MAYSEKIEYKIEIIPPYSVIQVRKATITLKDGVEVGRVYERSVASPGQDLASFPSEVKKVATALWSPANTAAYKASISDPFEYKESTSPLFSEST